MELAWTDFGAALALLLVIEGVMPFLAPAAMRRTLATMAELPDRPLRLVGGGSMAAGLLLLYLVR